MIVEAITPRGWVYEMAMAVKGAQVPFSFFAIVQAHSA